MKLKLISLIVLLCFSTSIACADVIQFDEVTAQKLDGDINFLRKSVEVCTAQQDNLKQQIGIQDKEITVLKEKAVNLNIDIVKALKAESDYKALYVKADNARLKVEEDSPSRTTWFLAGAITTAVLGIVAALLVK